MKITPELVINYLKESCNVKISKKAIEKTIMHFKTIQQKKGNSKSNETPACIIHKHFYIIAESD